MYDNAFPYSLRRYKEIPLSITNEEYQLLKKELGNSTSSTPTKNTVSYKKTQGISVILYIISIIIIFVAFVSFTIGIGDDEPMSIVLSLVALLQGILLIGFGKIIQLLSNIEQK